MDKVLKRRWLAALRSGDYKQGQNALCKVKSDGRRAYCCLGVLNEVAGVPFKYKGDQIAYANGGESPFATGLNDYYLQYELGLPRTALDALPQLNDIECLDFNQIADWIEEKVPVDN